MRFIVLREVFVKILSQLQGVCEKKALDVVSGCVCLRLQGDMLEVVATDGDIYAQHFLQVSDGQDGMCLVQLRVLYDVVRYAGCGQNITVEKKDDNTLTVESVSASFDLNVNIGEFPVPPTLEEKLSFDITGEQLVNIFNNVGFSVSRNDSRRYLTGINWDFSKNGCLIAVATDAIRLALCNYPVTNIVGGDMGTNVTLPYKSMQELCKMFEGEELVSVGISDCVFCCKTDNKSFYSCLLQLHFPSYQNIIPVAKDRPNVAILSDAPNLVRSITHIMSVSDSKSQALCCCFQNDSVTFSVHDSKLGTGKETVAIKYSGDPITIHFNSQYIIDLLNHLPDAVLNFGTSMQSVLVTSKMNKEVTHVLMPMKID